MHTNRDIELKRVLVTGASGLLGLNFCNFYCRKYDVVGISNKTQLFSPPFSMISRDLLHEDPGDLLTDLSPDIVLHCAAMANIDQCQKYPEDAAAINSVYPGRLAAEARKRGMKFVHISTDAVFDGEDCGKSGYREDDRTNPISCYAETKLKGEQNVLDSDPDAIVARVNFYGWSLSGKRSLAEFFYNNLEAGNPMNGFSDVFFCTLYIHSLADILSEMIGLDAKGIYHVFSSEHQSKYDFGVSIAKRFGFDLELVRPVSWKDGGLAAKRSPNLIMNTEKLRKLLGHDLPGQQENLEYFYRDTAAGLRRKIQNFGEPNHTEA